jgi:hypothetical protein
MVINMSIPADPIILLSYINTQLRDNYSSISDLCACLCIDEDGIKEKLASVGYSYNEELNTFR